MIDPVILRATVRKVLALRPRDSLSEAMLKLGIERVLGLAPETLPVPDFQKAVEWNHARNLIEYRYDEDAEANFWSLTDAGKAKEGVK